MFIKKEMNVFVNIKKRYPFFKDLEIVNILKYYIERKAFHIDLGDELDIFEQYLCESNIMRELNNEVLIKHEGMNTIIKVTKEDAIDYLNFEEKDFNTILVSDNLLPSEVYPFLNNVTIIKILEYYTAKKYVSGYYYDKEEIKREVDMFLEDCDKKINMNKTLTLYHDCLPKGKLTIDRISAIMYLGYSEEDFD